MAEFTAAEWNAIGALLASDEERFGLPERRSKSVVLSSFNIRKLGKRTGRTDPTWSFLADFCRRCDLVAIQEVQDDLSGLRHLRELCGEKYGLVVSDTTGGVPGRRASNVERLAFLFRWDRIERTEVASDITFDRTAVFDALYSSRFDFWEAFETRTEELGSWESVHAERLAAWKKAGSVGSKPRRRSKPAFRLPEFVTFIRTPNCASFRIKGTAKEFLAINAHLLYGDKSTQAYERWLEFVALLNWLVQRAKRVENLAHPSFILLGDLNLDFDEVNDDRAEIEIALKDLNSGELASPKAAEVYFPFLDPHPSRAHIQPPEAAVFRSTARLTQTYDQIAFFRHDASLPGPADAASAGATKDGFDYGVFRFTDLFSEVILGEAWSELTKTQRKTFIRRYEHEVSDHLPIWVRLPKA